MDNADRTLNETYGLFTDNFLDSYAANAVLNSARLSELKNRNAIVCDSGWSMPSEEGTFRDVSLVYFSNGNVLNIKYMLTNKEGLIRRIAIRVCVPRYGSRGEVISEIMCAKPLNSSYGSFNHTRMHYERGKKEIVMDSRGLPISAKTRIIPLEEVVSAIEKQRMLLGEVSFADGF